MNPSRPAAALDIGSNSVHLLVADRGPDGAPVPWLDVSHQAPIGRTVVATGEMGTELREELVTTVAGYLRQAGELGATTRLLLGTEAVRQAADSSALESALRTTTGVSMVVLDRSSEGLLTLLGVTRGRVPPAVAVVDIGGGSTEVTMTRPDGRAVVGIVPVGSAHLALAHIHHDPVTDAEIATLRDAARTHVRTLDVPRPDRVIVAGGSGTNVSRLLGRERTTPIDRATIVDALAVLRAYPAKELAARTGLTERRVGQLAAGIAIGEALFDRLELEVAEVSDASLREGALIACWAAGDDWLAALTELIRGGSPDRRADPAPDGRDRAS